MVILWQTWPDSKLWVHSLSVREAVVIQHLQAIPFELVVQKLFRQVELDAKKDEVKKLTCSEIVSYLM